MKRSSACLLILLAFALVFPTAPACAGFENLQPSPWVKKEPYMEKTIHKLGFGILNGITGWTAFFFEPVRQSNIFTGLLKGSWRTVTNTAGGALHIVTFPVPIDIPLPDGGVHFEN